MVVELFKSATFDLFGFGNGQPPLKFTYFQVYCTAWSGAEVRVSRKLDVYRNDAKICSRVVKFNCAMCVPQQRSDHI